MPPSGTTPRESWKQRPYCRRAGGTDSVASIVHDLWISKAIAGRPKDIEFCQALVERGLARGDQLTSLLGEVDEVDERVRAAVARRIP